MIGALLFLLAEAAAQGSTPDAELLLVCNGSMAGEVGASSTSAVVTDSNGNDVTGRSVTTRSGEFQVSIQFHYNNGQAEVNLPKAALPDINSAKGGWLKVKDLTFTETEITGKVRYNFLSSTRFRIDRRTGIMTSSGGFQGLCEKQDIQTQRF